MEEAAKDIWREYQATRDREVRNRLILANLPLVKHLAGRLAVRLPALLTQDDLEGYGVFGLIEAIEKYDPSLGVDFQTYAYRRVRGAMLDELRRLSWIPRQLWQKLQRVNAVRERLEGERQGAVSNAEMAEALGCSLEEFGQLARHFSSMSLVSLDEAMTIQGGDVVGVSGLVQDTTSPDPLEAITAAEDEDLLARAVEGLEEKDRLVLALYYQEQMTLKEIGRVLGVSESRVCQLHGRAVTRLRERLRDLDEGPRGVKKGGTG